MTLMYCASCGLDMERQPLGQWFKQCPCIARYWTNVAPTPKDRKTYYQLTGKGVKESQPEDGHPGLFRY